MLFLKEINFSLKFIFCTPFCFYSGLIITKSRSNILPIMVGNLSTANNICSKEYTSVKISLAAYCHNKNWGIVGWYLSILLCYFTAHAHSISGCSTNISIFHIKKAGKGTRQTGQPGKDRLKIREICIRSV